MNEFSHLNRKKNTMNEQNITQSDTIEHIKAKKSTKVQKKKLMLEILRIQLGIVSIACRQVGISRETHYRWIKEDPKYKKEVEDIVFYTKDFFESALFKLIEEGNPMAVWNTNKTKNRDRGYGENINIEHKGVEQLKVIIEEKKPEAENVKEASNNG